MPSGFQAIAPDARSHGLSDRVYEAASCKTERLAADVVALLDHLEVPQASLFGFSMGGGIALRAAMDQPARVKAVVVGRVGDSALNQLHDPSEISQLVAAFSAPSGDEVAPVRQPVLVDAPDLLNHSASDVSAGCGGAAAKSGARSGSVRARWTELWIRCASHAKTGRRPTPYETARAGGGSRSLQAAPALASSRLSKFAVEQLAKMWHLGPPPLLQR